MVTLERAAVPTVAAVLRTALRPRRSLSLAAFANPNRYGLRQRSCAGFSRYRVNSVVAQNFASCNPPPLHALTTSTNSSWRMLAPYEPTMLPFGP